MDKYMVRGSDGSVDLKASVAAYHNALAKWVSENEISADTVRNAVDAVFNERGEGTRLTLPILVSYAMGKIDHSPAQYTAIESRIRAFLKGNARFESTKGKGGGVARLALDGQPLPAKTA